MSVIGKISIALVCMVGLAHTAAAACPAPAPPPITWKEPARLTGPALSPLFAVNQPCQEVLFTTLVRPARVIMVNASAAVLTPGSGQDRLSVRFRVQFALGGVAGEECEQLLPMRGSDTVRLTMFCMTRRAPARQQSSVTVRVDSTTANVRFDNPELRIQIYLGLIN